MSSFLYAVIYWRMILPSLLSTDYHGVFIWSFWAKCNRSTEEPYFDWKQFRPQRSKQCRSCSNSSSVNSFCFKTWINTHKCSARSLRKRCMSWNWGNGNETSKVLWLDASSVRNDFSRSHIKNRLYCRAIKARSICLVGSLRQRCMIMWRHESMFFTTTEIDIIEVPWIVSWCRYCNYKQSKFVLFGNAIRIISQFLAE